MEREFELEEEAVHFQDCVYIDYQYELSVPVREVKGNCFFSVLYCLVWKQKKEWSSLVIYLFLKTLK